MLFKVRYVPEGTLPEAATHTTEQEVKSGGSVAEMCEAIHKKFKEAGVELDAGETTDFALHMEGDVVVLSDAQIDPLLERVERSGINAELCFFLHPDVRAKHVLEGLSDTKKVKGVAFKLKTLLAETVFAQSFISGGGIATLLDVISSTTGNTQSYCLAALSIVVGYEEGMNKLTQAPLLMKQLVHMVQSPMVAVQRLSLELLHTIASGKGRGAVLVSEVIEENAKEDKVEPYASFIMLLDSGDLDTKTNCLKLLNDIMTAATSENRRKLQDQFEKLGMREILKRNLDITNQSFVRQLEYYEKVTGSTIMEVTRDDLVRQVRQYELQQPLVKLMRDELLQARDAIREAETNEVYISYRAPLRRYLDRRINIEEKIKGPVRLDLVFAGGTRGGTRQETLETKGVRQLLDMKNKECKALKEEIKGLKGTVEVFEEQKAKLEAREEMMGLLEAEISSKQLQDDQDDSDYVDALPGQAVYVLTFDSAKALKLERIQSWISVMQYRASKPGQKVLLAATHLDELPRDKEARERVLTKLSGLIEKLMKQWVVNYADVVEVKDEEADASTGGAELKKALERIQSLEVQLAAAAAAGAGGAGGGGGGGAALADTPAAPVQRTVSDGNDHRLDAALAELAEMKQRQTQLEAQLASESAPKDEAVSKVKYLLGVSKKVMEKMEAMKKESAANGAGGADRTAIDQERAALAEERAALEQEKEELEEARRALEERSSASAAAAGQSDEIQALREELELEKEVLAQERELMEQEVMQERLEMMQEVEALKEEIAGGGGAGGAGGGASSEELEELKEQLALSNRRAQLAEEEAQATRVKLEELAASSEAALDEKMGDLELEREVLEQERMLLEEELEKDREELERAREQTKAALAEAEQAKSELAKAQKVLDADRKQFELSKGDSSSELPTAGAVVSAEEHALELEVAEQEKLLLQGEIDELTTKVDIYEQALTEATAKLQEMKEAGDPAVLAQELREANERAAEILEALEQTENQLGVTQEKLEEELCVREKLEKVNIRLKSELESGRSTSDTLKLKESEIEEIRAEASMRQAKVEAELAAVKEKLAAVEEKLAAKEQEVAAKEQEVAAKAEALAEAKATLQTEMEATLASVEKAKVVEEEAKSLSEELELVRMDLEVVQQERTLMEEEMKKDADALALFAEEAEIKEQEWLMKQSEWQTREKELSSSLSELRAKVAELEEAATAAASSSDVDVGALAKEKEEAVKEAEELKEQLESLRADRDLLLEEAAELRKTAEGQLTETDLQKRISRLQRIMIQTMTAKKTAEAKLKTVQDELKALKA